MGKRREAREAALQFLFGGDLKPVDARSIPRAELTPESEPAPEADSDPESDACDRLLFWHLRPAEPEVQRFTDEIVTGVHEHRGEIDSLLKQAASNYRLDRITTVDRNILRIAIYEMVFREEIPPVVSINEAIEIAKRFGTDESGRFVNGILDRIKRDLNQPRREPIPNESD